MRKSDYYWLMAAVYIAPHLGQVMGLSLGVLWAVVGIALTVVEMRSEA